MMYIELIEESTGDFLDYYRSKMISERFINLIGDHPDKQKYKDEVHDMLTKAYIDQGGIHGSGFESPEAMTKHIPMWKLHVKNGKLKAAVMYKDSGTAGRKLVAVASDASEEGKRGASEMMKADYLKKRAHAEISGKTLSFMKRHVNVQGLAKSFDEAKAYHAAKGDTISKPADDDPEVLRHPELKHLMYTRKIGNEMHTKILLGTTGKKIV